MQTQGRLREANEALQQAKGLTTDFDSQEVVLLPYLRTTYTISLEEAKLRTALGDRESGLRLARYTQDLPIAPIAISGNNLNDRRVLAFAWSRELRMLLDVERFQEVNERGRVAHQEVTDLITKSGDAQTYNWPWVASSFF